MKEYIEQLLERERMEIAVCQEDMQHLRERMAWYPHSRSRQSRMDHLSRKRKEAQIKISLLEDILKNSSKEIEIQDSYVEAEVGKDNILLSYSHAGMKVTEVVNMRHEIKEKAIQEWLINNGWTSPY